MYRTDFGILWEKARVGCSERIALKQVYSQGWNRSLAQVRCMRQVLRAGVLGRFRGMGWGEKWEGVSGWETRVNPWLIHVNVWQKPLQYCKVISLQLIKKKKEKRRNIIVFVCWFLYFVTLLNSLLLLICFYWILYFNILNIKSCNLQIVLPFLFQSGYL